MSIEIERCRLHYRCTQRWEALESLPGTMRVRYCTQCQSAVHLAQSSIEFDELARQGKCVALKRDGRTIQVGLPAHGRDNWIDECAASLHKPEGNDSK